jgi:hypothetical protein
MSTVSRKCEGFRTFEVEQATSKRLMSREHNKSCVANSNNPESPIDKCSVQVPLSSQMVDTMCVGARTFPLLIAALRSSGTVGGTKSLTGEITFFSTCTQNSTH